MKKKTKRNCVGDLADSLVQTPAQDGTVRPTVVNQNGANVPHATPTGGQGHYSQLKQNLLWVKFVLSILEIFFQILVDFPTLFDLLGSSLNFLFFPFAFLEGTNNVLDLYQNVLL